MKPIKIGVIADDFTGASDAATLLYQSGMKTLIQSNIGAIDPSYDVVVMALKSRSVSVTQAIKMSKEAVDHLLANGYTQIYFKYCSTFDSTPHGNIGVVLDFLVEYLKVSYTLLCPSMPINGRTLLHGNLYVHGIKLDDSHMKYHPLNPMWSASIAVLMKDQSKYPCFVISRALLDDPSGLSEQIAMYKKTYEHFYLVPDYEDDADAQRIVARFKHLPLLSGGSGLLEFLGDKSVKYRSVIKKVMRRSIILCGSCSKVSKQQIDCYRQKGGIVYKMDVDKLILSPLLVNEIIAFACKQKRTVLVYSMDDLNESKNTTGEKAKQIENIMAMLAKQAIAHGFKNIVVAGGETSGAVVKELGYDNFEIGEVIDPGVPALYPLQNDMIRLVLKSGNFGSDNFFEKAIQ